MKKFLLFILSLVTFCTFIGCRSARPTAQLVREVHTDTLYLSSLQYDSIYIFQERTSDYHMNPLNPLKPSETDTVFIKDVSVEYRYKLLRDTIKVVQRDSIPYEVTITEIKEVPRPKTWFDRLCRYAFFLLCGALLFFVYRCIRKFI